MSKALVIAEKPSVAKDIAKALGGFSDQKEYLESETLIITWAVGHLVEFISPEEIDVKYKAWKLEDLPILPGKFKLKAKDKCGPRIKIIKQLLKRDDVDNVINACDAGREGELIFRELMDFCKTANMPSRRLWLQSMTPDAIRSGFAGLRPGSDYENLHYAAQCRSEADWLIGINATRALTRRLKTHSEKTSWSAGRVQTPTLAMLTDRELDILRFRPTPFWKLAGNFTTPAQGGSDSHSYEGVWYDPQFKENPDSVRKNFWITEAELLQKIMAACLNRQGVATETRKPSNESARPLFDLTSLQREANRRFGMSARNTLAAAQRLYESYKLITYPRTSSQCLPKDYVKPVNDLLHMFSGYGTRPAEDRLSFPTYVQAARWLLDNKLENTFRIFNDAAITDHFAIIPTLQRVTRPLRDDEAKIYDLIVRRFLAAFFPPAVKVKVERTTVITAESGENYYFRTTATHLAKEGWMAVFGRDAGQEKEKELPALIYPEGEKQASVVNNSLTDTEEETKPPARLNDARLLALMESAGKQCDDEEMTAIMKDKGLGTPATRAEIIEALITRGYAERADHALKATTKGIMLIDMLGRIAVPRLTSPSLTGEMELHLNQVEQGAYERKLYMEEISGYTVDIVEKTKAFQYDSLYDNEEPVGPCPLCGSRKVREHLRFYACEGNSGRDSADCPFIIWKDKNGRYLDRTTVQELLKNKHTEILEGFKGTGPHTYKAKLRMSFDNQQVEVENLGEAGEVPVLSVSDTPLGTCPFDPECQVMETQTSYCCTKKCVEKGSHKSGFILPRVICQRPISHEELFTYLNSEEHKTEFLENFISRFGKQFTGRLFLKPTGKHGFEFAPRAPRKKAGDDTGTAEEKPKTTRTRKTAGATEEKPKTTRTRKTASAAEEKPKTTRTRKTASAAEEKPKTTRTRKTASATEEKPKTTRTRKTASAAEEKPKTTRTRKTASAAEDIPI